MKNKTLVLHILGSLGFMLLPIITSPDFNTGRNLFSIPPFLNSFSRQFLLLLFFYLNYYLLLPRFYFKNKKWIYAFLLLLCAAVIYLVPSYFFSFGPPKPRFDALPDMGRKPPLFHFMEGGITQFLFVFVLSLFLKIQNRFETLKNEKLNAEVSYLKAQINPHFLFNTLNSLYALTLQKSNEAPKAVLKLSGIMRYVVTESSRDFVSLAKELDYISDYIELQKLRLDDGVNLEYTVIGSTANKQIAPLLLIPFIENAFKYGINPDENSFIKIVIKSGERDLEMMVQNAIVANPPEGEGTTEQGIDNTLKRLEIMYPNKHKIQLTQTPETYTVNLKLFLE